MNLLFPRKCGIIVFIVTEWKGFSKEMMQNPKAIKENFLKFDYINITMD